jgi:GT2 family glycosyltransferase
VRLINQLITAGPKNMKLSIVIICWNDWKVLENCILSIFENTHKISFEVIVSDNGSTDGSVEKIRAQFPAVRVLENGANLGFAKGNNAGIREAQGEYVLILNPDTIIHDGSLDRWIQFADQHPESGAFGCRVQNPDGTYQRSARPFPTIARYLTAALYLRFLGHLRRPVLTREYDWWKGNTEREVDWQSGCCVMLRGELLKQLGGFDESFFYQFEEVDLCRRVWDAGYRIRFTPEASITHLGGQSVKRFPARFAIEVCRNGYRYFFKHFGYRGARQYRLVVLVSLAVRRIGYGALHFFRPSEELKNRLEVYRLTALWNKRLDPIQFVDRGIEHGTDVPSSLQTT